MRFFNKYPKIDYKFGSLTTSNEFTNLSVYADILDKIKDDTTTYTYYTIQDGERPDVVSSRLYGSPVYDWTFFILNDDIKDQGWPLSYQEFRSVLTKKMPGRVITITGTDTHSSTGLTVHAMTEKFKIGDTVIGATSNAQGTVYMRNVNLGQIFIKQTTNAPYQNGENIVDSITSPTQSLMVNTSSLAYQAAHHYLNSDNSIVDIDPTTLVVPANYTEITHEEFLQNKNSSLSRIKVIKPNLINKFTSLFTQAINAQS